jgi:hypothetical protein
MVFKKIAFSLMFSLLCFSCVGKNALIMTPNKAKAPEQERMTWQTATVIFVKLEGGFYGLLAQDGSKLLPINLAPQYQIPNTTLNIQGKKVEGMMPIQQWGVPFEIINIELVELGIPINRQY